MELTPAATAAPGHDFDVARARRDTPGALTVTHLNNAGAALPPAQVTDAVIEHLRREADMGGYEAAAARPRRSNTPMTPSPADRRRHRRDRDHRERDPGLGHGLLRSPLPARRPDPDLPRRVREQRHRVTPGRRSVPVPSIEVVDDDETGQLSVGDLRRRLDDGRGPVKLIAVTHVPTQGGLVNPAAEIGAASPTRPGCRLPARCLPVHRPAPHRRRRPRLRPPLCAPAANSCAGPRGTGLPLRDLDLVREHLEPPFLDLHAATWTSHDQYEIRADARRFENWETNYAAKIGLGVAVDYALVLGPGCHRGARHRPRGRLAIRSSASCRGVQVHDRGAGSAAS